MRPAVKSRAVDYIGHLAVYDEREHAGPVVRIVFEVGVLNDDNISGNARQAGSHRGAFASVALVKQNGEGNASEILWTVRRELEPAAGLQTQAAPASLALAEVLLQPLGSTVARSVVDNDNLLRDFGQRLGHLDRNAPNRA